MKQNVAYDLEMFENRELRVVRKPVESEEKSVQTKSSSKVFVRIQLLIASAILFGLAILMIRGKVIEYEKISEAEILQNEFEILQSEEVRLRSELEQMSSDRNIEKYASEVLGLIKATRSQIKYFNTKNTDEVIIVKKEANENVFSEIRAFFSTEEENEFAFLEANYRKKDETEEDEESSDSLEESASSEETS